MALGDVEADALHVRKNPAVRPWEAAVDRGELTFPPYRYQPFPCAMYHATDPRSPVLVRDETEKRIRQGQGWADSPDEAKAVGIQVEADRFEDAAVRAFDDRRVSPAAQAEVAAQEAAVEDVVSEMPAAPKRRGRPRKTTEGVA